MSEPSDHPDRSLILPASLAVAAVLTLTVLLWAEHGEAVFLDALAAGFVGCFG